MFTRSTNGMPMLEHSTKLSDVMMLPCKRQQMSSCYHPSKWFKRICHENRRVYQGLLINSMLPESTGFDFDIQKNFQIYTCSQKIGFFPGCFLQSSQRQINCSQECFLGFIETNALKFVGLWILSSCDVTNLTLLQNFRVPFESHASQAVVKLQIFTTQSIHYCL